MARSWLPEATTVTDRSRAPSYMIRLRVHGIAPLTSTRIAILIQLPCFKTARSWLRAASVVVHLHKLASLLTARSYTTRSQAIGVAPAISTQLAMVTRRHYCLTA